MGGNPFMLPGSASLRRGPNGASAAERASRLDDSLMSSDTDDEDEDSSSFLPAGGASIHELFRQLGAPFGAHRHPAGIVVGSAPHGLRMGTMPVFESPAAVARSYASNVGDRTAGRATNPLEIDDDSDDEDDIEVVQVTRPL
eukprot:Sro1251_g256150.1 n/a (142) ;mRNA; r:9213-9638